MSSFVKFLVHAISDHDAIFPLECALCSRQCGERASWLLCNLAPPGVASFRPVKKSGDVFLHLLPFIQGCGVVTMSARMTNMLMNLNPRQLMGKKRQRSSVEPLSAASTVTATTTRTPGSRTARPLVPAAMPRRMPPARPRRKLLQWLLRWPMARPRRLRRRLVSWRRLALRASGESAAGSAPRCWSARGCAARAILPTGETARMRPGEFSCGLHPLARLRPPCWLHGGPVCGNA